MLKRLLPLVIAVAGIISAIAVVRTMMKPIPEAEPVVAPAANPYCRAIAATGLVEACHENVPIGTHVPGIVGKVFVSVWQEVNEGDPLFQIDSQEIEAQIEVDRAKLKVAQAKLERLQDQYDRVASIQDTRAVSRDTIKTKEFDVLVAKEEVDLAEKELKLKETQLKRMTVLAPRQGIIIQKNIKGGDYLSLSPREPAILLGDLHELHVRADVDEQNACRVMVKADAVAYPKNRPDLAIPLEFIRIEPYVAPKKSLTGMSDERVDTRVLQVIYRLTPPEGFPLYVGQQVDVFLNGETKA